MTYDVVLSDISRRVDAMPRRWAVALFLAASGALRPGLVAWATPRGVAVDDLVREAMLAAERFAVEGRSITGGAQLVAALEAATPPGESPDAESSTVAQDCWICLDTAVRGAVDEHFAMGAVIEYALEPKLQAVTERLFGVASLGSGPGEAAAEDEVLADASLRTALGFIEEVLASARTDGPTADELVHLTERARVLSP